MKDHAEYVRLHTEMRHRHKRYDEMVAAAAPLGRIVADDAEGGMNDGIETLDERLEVAQQLLHGWAHHYLTRRE